MLKGIEIIGLKIESRRKEEIFIFQNKKIGGGEILHEVESL